MIEIFITIILCIVVYLFCIRDANLDSHYETWKSCKKFRKKDKNKPLDTHSDMDSSYNCACYQGPADVDVSILPDEDPYLNLSEHNMDMINSGEYGDQPDPESPDTTPPESTNDQDSDSTSTPKPKSSSTPKPKSDSPPKPYTPKPNTPKPTEDPKKKYKEGQVCKSNGPFDWSSPKSCPPGQTCRSHSTNFRQECKGNHPQKCVCKYDP